MNLIIPLGQKNTLAEYMILSGADNRPPMLDKDLYDTWKSQMELYMQNRKHRRMILELVENGSLIWPAVEENGVTRTKKYAELSAAEKIQAGCDLKATNIILQEQFQVNTKFLNNLPPEWSKSVTDVKLVKDLHTTNFDQLHAYLVQHELHANEFRLTHECNQDPLSFVVNQQMTSPDFNTYHFVALVFSLRDDPIACLNKAMAFLTVVASSSGCKSNAVSFGGYNASGQARVFKCYNCQGEGHMAWQCTQPKPTRNAAWYKEKAMLPEAREAGQILDEEQLAFLADPGVLDGQPVQIIIPNTAAIQTKDLNTYYSDCDVISNAKAVLLANISNYGSDIISEVPHSETNLNDMENQDVHAMVNLEQPPVVDFPDNKINSSRDKMIDSQMDDMIKEKLTLKEQVDLLEQNLSKQIKEKECLLQTFTAFKRESKQMEAKNIENEIDLKRKIKELDNIIFKDFGKRFVPQQELSADETLWYHMLNPSTKSSDALHVKIEAPKEHPKEHADILRGIVEQAKAKQPLDNSLDFACYPDCSLASGLRMFKTHDRESLSAHELSSKTKSWLWHHQLSHLHFGTFNKLAKDDLARGIPKLKFNKDHLCLACTLGKSKKSAHQPKAEHTNQEKLFWKSKDKAPEAIIKCIRNIQVSLNTTVRNVQIDNETEFVNQTLREFYENVGISIQTSVACTPLLNDVVERRNRTLVKAARTMLIFSEAPLFLWAEEINIAYYTLNRSIIRSRYNKTPYELMHDKKPDLSFFHVFGALCYLTNDNDDMGKLDAKVDIGIFVGYAPAKKAFRIYNKRTQKLIETIHVTFDELTAMASEQFTIVVPPVQEAAAPRAVDLADSPMSTSIDQDAPPSNTLLVEKSKLDEDLQGKPVDATLYYGMIGSLMYRTSTRPDLTYAGTINMGLWYSNDTGMSLTTYAEADHAGCQDTRLSTSGSAQCIGDKLVSYSSKKQKRTAISSTEAEYIALSGVVLKSYGCVHKFKIDKKKRFKITLEVFRDIFKICPRVQGQDFDALPTNEEIVSFLRDLGHTGEIHSLNDTTGLDKLRLSRAQILWGMYHQKSVDYVELLWEDFIYQIDNKAYKKQDKMYYPRFTKVIIHHFLTQDKTLSWRNKIRIHTSKDDYLINTLRFVFAKEETQIYGAILPESLTSPEMKETKAYKTYLGFATGATSPKKARKFKKPGSLKLTIVPVSTEEPMGKLKRVKRPIKKSTQALARGVVIRETLEIPVSKKKEKVDVARQNGIELMSDVALTKDAQYEEVRKKSLRDFHKTYPSGSGTATKPTPSTTIIKPFVTNEGTDDSNNDQDSRSDGSDQEKASDDDKTQSDNENESVSKHETNESGSESDQEEDEEKIKDDEEEEEEEIAKTPSNDSDNLD
uniref:Retrovirus-related Pol polyprotein from transposon TNT 1-94 n=1 Tax=Tanacetum cinerariifolium TaxID=118510 RepID=A0A6L2NHC5_TANCI|nr:hypothetical protein [Tanacetum cinerariifolium]